MLDARASAFNLTNERGIDGTIRLLRNVMGLWLVQECRRAWGDPDYDELHRLAAEADPGVALFDPDADAFLAPDDMPARDRRGLPRGRPGAAGQPRRDPALGARVAGLQVPPGARAPERV